MATWKIIVNVFLIIVILVAAWLLYVHVGRFFNG